MWHTKLRHWEISLTEKKKCRDNGAPSVSFGAIEVSKQDQREKINENAHVWKKWKPTLSPPFRRENIWKISYSWWFQPIWKNIISSNWIISPNRDEHEQYLSCHHLEKKGGICITHFIFKVIKHRLELKSQVRSTPPSNQSGGTSHHRFGFFKRRTWWSAEATWAMKKKTDWARLYPGWNTT